MATNSLGPFFGSQIAPGPNTNILLQNLAAIKCVPGAFYKVDFTLYIDNSTGGADDDNMLVGPFYMNTYDQVAVPASPASTTPVITKYSFAWQYTPGKPGTQTLLVVKTGPATTASGGSVYHACAVLTQIDSADDLPSEA
jgi:hypothetical protein